VALTIGYVVRLQLGWFGSPVATPLGGPFVLLTLAYSISDPDIPLMYLLLFSQEPVFGGISLRVLIHSCLPAR